MQNHKTRISFIGTVGIPNKYGGFEAFLENCAPLFVDSRTEVMVTCYSRRYDDHSPSFKGVHRRFIPLSANGASSILHDFAAFFSVFFWSTHIVVLGVSGGIFFPLFRVLCTIFGKQLVVNIDGVEWQRGKFSRFKRGLLWLFDSFAQISANVIVYDNKYLFRFVKFFCRRKATMIGYSGDHVIRAAGIRRISSTGLTVCRIEPENNIEMIITGVLLTPDFRHTIVGNWDSSVYGRSLRKKYAHEPRLSLLDPIYEPDTLSVLREACDIYIHGHSVGGTNPSLVEMIFYDCRLVCYDVPFHHGTVGDSADYFRDACELCNKLTTFSNKDPEARAALRRIYTGKSIVDAYRAIF